MIKGIAMPEEYKRLFTIVMDFEGTTSVSQFHADSVEPAVRLWLSELALPLCFGLTPKQRKRLANGRRDLDLGLAPVPLSGLSSAWCTGVSADGSGSALLNIIETVIEVNTAK